MPGASNAKLGKLFRKSFGLMPEQLTGMTEQLLEQLNIAAMLTPRGGSDDVVMPMSARAWYHFEHGSTLSVRNAAVTSEVDTTSSQHDAASSTETPREDDAAISLETPRLGLKGKHLATAGGVAASGSVAAATEGVAFIALALL